MAFRYFFILPSSKDERNHESHKAAIFNAACIILPFFMQSCPSDAGEHFNGHGQYSFLQLLLNSHSGSSSVTHGETMSSMDDHCSHAKISSHHAAWEYCNISQQLRPLSSNPVSLHNTMMYQTGDAMRIMFDLNDASNESNSAVVPHLICPMHQQQVSCDLDETAWVYLPATSQITKDEDPCLRLLHGDMSNTVANSLHYGKSNPVMVDSSSQIPVGLSRDIILPFSPMKDKCGSSFTSEIATCSQIKLSRDCCATLLGSVDTEVETENDAYFGKNAAKSSIIPLDNLQLMEAGTAYTPTNLLTWGQDLREWKLGNPTASGPLRTVSNSPSGESARCTMTQKCQTTNLQHLHERRRRERISRALKAMHELVPNPKKGNQISVLDDIIDYVKFLQLQVKVLSQNRLLSALSEDTFLYLEGFGHFLLTEPRGNDAVEDLIDNLMESDMSAAIQLLQSKGLCLLPIALAAHSNDASLLQ